MGRYFKETIFWTSSNTPTGEPAFCLLESEPAPATYRSIHGQLASLIMNNFLLFRGEERQRHDSGALKLNYCLCLSLPSQTEPSAAAASPGKDESSHKHSCSTQEALLPLAAQPPGTETPPDPAGDPATCFHPERVASLQQSPQSAHTQQQTTSGTQLPNGGSWK